MKKRVGEFLRGEAVEEGGLRGSGGEKSRSSGVKKQGIITRGGLESRVQTSNELGGGCLLGRKKSRKRARPPEGDRKIFKREEASS